MSATFKFHCLNNAQVLKKETQPTMCEGSEFPIEVSSGIGRVVPNCASICCVVFQKYQTGKAFFTGTPSGKRFFLAVRPQYVAWTCQGSKMLPNPCSLGSVVSEGLMGFIYVKLGLSGTELKRFGNNSLRLLCLEASGGSKLHGFWDMSADD